MQSNAMQSKARQALLFACLHNNVMSKSNFTFLQRNLFPFSLAYGK